MSNSSQGGFDSFCAVIEDILTLFEDLIDFENKKLDAIAANEVTILDQYLNDEQAYLLKMRSLDQKREKAQKQLGVSDLSFREMKEMSEKFDDAERETLSNLYERLSSKTLELQDSISATKKYIDLHLNAISSLLERLDGNAATYGKSGEKEDPQSPPKRFTSTKA